MASRFAELIPFLKEIGQRQMATALLRPQAGIGNRRSRILARQVQAFGELDFVQRRQGFYFRIPAHWRAGIRIS